VGVDAKFICKNVTRNTQLLPKSGRQQQRSHIGLAQRRRQHSRGVQNRQFAICFIRRGATRCSRITLRTC